MSVLFLYLTIILATVTIFLGIMKIFRQPLILGYILAGTFLTFLFPNFFHGNHVIELLADFGILFLLFGVGMELNIAVIKNIGSKVVLSGFFQVLITFLLGLGILLGFGFELGVSVLISIGLAFSSTIVTLKLIGDVDKLDTTFGKISTGILITQDLIVMIVLTLMSTFGQLQSANFLLILVALIFKIFVLFLLLYLGKKYFLKYFISKIASSSEFLFLFSISWCMILASVFAILGFSPEIGALIAGILLADSEYKYEISSKIKSLKDFFLVMFFVLLGSRIDISNVKNFDFVLILSAFVLLLKPLITYSILTFKGYDNKNSFLSAISLSQISEFSFLLIMMGIKSGKLNSERLNLITMVGLITIAFSSYFIFYGEKLWNIFKKLPFVKFKSKANIQKIQEGKYKILLIGYGRFGKHFIEKLPKNMLSKILVCDYNPEVLQSLKKSKVDYMFGDIGEIEFLEEIKVGKFDYIISSSKDFYSNLTLLEYLQKHHSNVKVIVIANYENEILEYSKFSNVQVIFPHHISAEFVVKKIK